MKKTFFGLTLVFAAHVAWGLQLSPSYQIFKVKPGKTVQGEYTLTNNEGAAVYVTPQTKNWIMNEHNTALNAEGWLTVDLEKFELKPGETKTIPFKAKAPRKAQGEMVGMVSLKTLTADRQQVHFVLSSAVYLAIKGREELKAEAVALTVTPSDDSVNAGVLVKNTGNVHIRPAGMFRIFNKEGQAMANIQLKRGQPTHPGKSRSYMGTVKDFRLPPGKYKAVISMRDLDRDVPILSDERKFKVKKNREVKW